MKLKSLLKEQNNNNPDYSDLKFTKKLGDILYVLDNILDDSTDYYDRKEYKKFDSDAGKYWYSEFNKKNINAEDLKNDIDSVVKFYETAIDNVIKKKLDILRKEADSLKSKIK